MRSARWSPLALLCACGSVDVMVAEWEKPTPSTGQYLEAESGLLSGGFTIGADLQASGGSYLAAPVGAKSDDQPGPARVRYDLTVTSAGDYVIWGRIHAPTAVNNRFWFSIDGGSWHKQRISVGDIWFWDAFHEDTQYGVPLVFPLGAGTHTLELADCVEGVWLDRLYVSADGDVPPGNDTTCLPPHSIELSGMCMPSCGSQRGTRCGKDACAGQTIVPAYDCDVCCIVP